MVKISINASLRERADHEVGHFLVANELALNCDIYWLTLEPREGGSGGSTGIHFIEDPPREHMIKYKLGGIAAQAFGLMFRREWTGSPEELAKRIMVSGYTDLHGIDEAEVAAPWNSCFDLVRENWPRYICVSDTLIEHGTLIGQEPKLILMALDEENVALSLYLQWYRARRQRVAPPPEWMENSSESHPAGDWFEDFAGWWEREGKTDGESLEDFYNRLFAR